MLHVYPQIFDKTNILSISANPSRIADEGPEEASRRKWPTQGSIQGKARWLRKNFSHRCHTHHCPRPHTSQNFISHLPSCLAFTQQGTNHVRFSCQRATNETPNLYLFLPPLYRGKVPASSCELGELRHNGREKCPDAYAEQRGCASASALTFSS